MHKPGRTGAHGKKLLLLLCVLLALTVTVGATLAYLWVKTPTLRNIFTPYEDLTITKKVVHPFGDEYVLPADLAFDFEVELPAQYEGQTLTTSLGDVTVTGGKALLRVPVGADGTGTVTLQGLDEEDRVIVTEKLAANSGFTVDGETKELTIDHNKEGKLTFTNTYAPAPAPAQGLTLTGTKRVEHADGWQDGETFAFLLQHKDAAGQWVDVGAAVTVTKDAPAFDLSAALQGFAFDTIGVYPFRVVEQSARAVAGPQYFDVTVGDADMDGALEIAAVTAGQSAVTVTTGAQPGQYAVAMAFVNRYPAGTIEIEKKMDDQVNSGRGPEGFRFELVDEAGRKLVSEPTTAAGETGIELIYAYEDVGKTFKYELREVDDKAPGVVYDTTVYDVTVLVTYSDATGSVGASILYAKRVPAAGGSGTLTAPVPTATPEPAATPEPTATPEPAVTPEPTATPEPAATPEPTATPEPAATPEPTATPEPAATPEPTATPEPSATPEPVQQLSARAGGLVILPLTDPAGTGGAPTVTTPGTGYTSEPVGKPVFVNVYSPVSAEHIIKGTKTLTGRDLKDGEFTFELYETDSDFAIEKDEKPLDTAVNVGTSFAFDPLSFDKATTRWFVVKEDDSAKLGGVSYSTATYHVTLTAAPDAAGGALAVTETVTDAGGMASALVFENRYGAAAYELYLSGRKELEGRTLGDGEFSFALYAYDDTAEQCKGAPLGTAANDENGRFVFDKQLLSAADQVYRYVIVEDGSAAAVGMTYDSTVYVVTVTVEDNGAGSMVLKEQTITKLGETDVLAEVLFKNIYVAPTPTPSPVPTATPKPTATPAPTAAPTATPAAGGSPLTGDTGAVELYALLLAASALAAAAVLFTERRKKHSR